LLSERRGRTRVDQDDTDPAEPRPDTPDPSRQQTLAAARELFRQERFTDVLETLKGIPDSGLQNDQALLLKAVALLNVGRLDEAERLMASWADPNAAALYLRAVCRERAGDRHTAAVHDRAAIELDPRFA